MPIAEIPELDRIQQDLHAGRPVQRMLVSDLLNIFGQKRRTPAVTEEISYYLRLYGLRTIPDFTSAWINSEIEIGLIDFGAAKATDSRRAEGARETIETSPLVRDDSLLAVVLRDPAYRISRLAAANRPPITVAPTDLVKKAITLMLANDYSQLPVTTNERNLKGLISWKSIGKRANSFGAPTTVNECLEPCATVPHDEYVFSAVGLILKHEVVVVLDATKKIVGIVTIADLGMLFQQLSEPFILIGEIENHVRNLFRQLHVDVLRGYLGSQEHERKIEEVDDLMFGDYVFMLSNEECWKKVKLPYDRKVLIAELDKVRNIRNSVMHFDPDGVTPEDLDTLRKMALFFQIPAAQ